MAQFLQIKVTRTVGGWRIVEFLWILSNYCQNLSELVSEKFWRIVQSWQILKNFDELRNVDELDKFWRILTNWRTLRGGGRGSWGIILVLLSRGLIEEINSNQPSKYHITEGDAIFLHPAFLDHRPGLGK